MSTPQHPLTETAANPVDARPWEPLSGGRVYVGDEVRRDYLGTTTTAVVGRVDEEGDPWTDEGRVIGILDEGTWYVRRIPAHTTEKETPLTETTAPAEPLARTLLGVPEGYGAPHHDASRIKPGDYVVQVDRDGTLRGGRAHRQDEKGDWQTEARGYITWDAWRADRPDAITVWPAPTPPAVEVEMPAERPAHLLDVEDEDGNVFAYMALDRSGYWVGVDQDGELRVRGAHRLPAFTLPDGTRVRRDGERADGAPRFVKVQVGEK